MDDELRSLIQHIHDSPPLCVLVTAGAGAQALAWLLGVPGASRTLLEALVPYAPAAFDDFLGRAPAGYVGADTARLLAGRALSRARWLNQAADPVVGVACTAAIVSDRPKRGDHRAHVATWEVERVRTYTLLLDKGARDRQSEEEVVSRLLLNALGRAFGLAERLSLPLTGSDALTEEESNLAAAAERLGRQAMPWFGVGEDGTLRHHLAEPVVLLSGSFNPLHDGHRGLAQTAAALTGRPVAFELSAVNVDKLPLSRDVILDRMAQFAGRWPVLVSTAPTFIEKARLFPGVIFAVGYDTAERILQPRYYGDSEAAMRAGLDEIQQSGCRFLVAGRVDDDSRFHDAGELDVPAEFAALFEPIPAGRFRHDVSSTELRQRGHKGSR